MDETRHEQSRRHREGKSALAAGGRVAAYWLARVDAAIAESAG
jgi:hypothetical protein